MSQSMLLNLNQEICSSGEKYKNEMAVEEAEKPKAPKAQNAINNFSKTLYSSDLSNSTSENDLPADGFDGAVFIRDGEFTRENGGVEFSMPRNTVVFHELNENYLRTEGGKDKKGLPYTKAHDQSSQDGNKFSKEVNGTPDARAGDADGFKPVNK